MNANPASHAGGAARPVVEVRVAGALITRIGSEMADTLIRRCWAEWRGRGGRRYLELTKQIPASSIQTWAGGNRRDGTRLLRADATCKSHSIGQLMGGGTTREFIPLVDLDPQR